MSEEKKTFSQADVDAAVSSAVKELTGTVNTLKEQLATDNAKRSKGNDDAIASLKSLYDKRLAGLEGDYAKAKTGYEEQNKVLLQQLAQRDQEILTSKKSDAINALAAELGGDSPTLVKSFLKERVVVNRNDKGIVETSYLSNDGKAVTADILKKEMYAHSEIKDRLKPLHSTGSERVENQPPVPHVPQHPMINNPYNQMQNYNLTPQQRHAQLEAQQEDFSRRVHDRYNRGEHKSWQESAMAARFEQSDGDAS